MTRFLFLKAELNNILLYVILFKNLFIFWWLFRLLPPLMLLWIMLQWTSLWYSILNSFEYLARSGTAGPQGNSTFHYWRYTILFLITSVPFYIPNTSAQSFQFLLIFVNTFYFLFLLLLFYSAFLTDRKWYHGFHLHFSNE